MKRRQSPAAAAVHAIREGQDPDGFEVFYSADKGVIK